MLYDMLNAFKAMLHRAIQCCEMFEEHGSVDLGKLPDARQLITMLAQNTTDRQKDIRHKNFSSFGYPVLDSI
jgi:hypothetical protein